MRPHLALCLSLFAAVSCIHRESIDSPETAAGESSELVLQPTTAIQTSSGISIQLWRSTIDTTVASFWPAGARRVKVLTSDGDAGDRTTGGAPTTYVWIVKDGASVYKAWRVITSQMSGFTAQLNHAIAVAQGGVDNGGSVMQGMVKRPGGWGGPIGPGGGGDLPTGAIDDVLAAAATL